MMNNTADIGLSIHNGTLPCNLNYLRKHKNKSQQKRMKHIILTAFLIAALAAKGLSQQAPPNTQPYNFSIADCINYAYNHQHDVINANLDVTSAGYHVREIIGQGLPQLTGSASFQDYIKSPTVLFPDFITPLTYSVLAKEGVKNGSGNPITVPAGAGLVPVNFTQKYNSNLGIAVSQILFDPNYIVGLQGRKTYKELYERSYTRTKIDASVNVTKAYYQVLVSVEQLKLLDANINQLKQQMDETAARNKQGFVEKIDVDRITVQYNSLVTTRENTLRLLALNYELLKFQMGMPIEADLTLKDKLEDVQLDMSSADAVNDTTVYHNRIEYGLLETQKRLYEYDLKSKKGQFLPKLTANGSYAAAYQNNSFGQLYQSNFPSSYIGLTLSLPLYAGGQHLYQVKQSQITVLKSQNDLLNMKNTVNLQVSQSRISYINGLQTLNDQKKNRALASEVLRVSKIKYDQGVGSSIEVTQAQTALQDADNTYIQGLYNALVSKVDLDKAYGRIK
jgi:outer membrane protein